MALAKQKTKPRAKTTLKPKAPAKAKSAAKPKKSAMPKQLAAAANWKKQQKMLGNVAQGMMENISDNIKKTKDYHTAAMEGHKKKIVVLKKAKIAADTAQSIASLNSHFVEGALDDMNKVARCMMTRKPGQPLNLSENLGVVKKSIQRSLEHAENLGSLLSQTRKTMFSHMTNRFQEMLATLGKASSKHKKR